VDLTPLFEQYLRRAAIPVLELSFDDAAQTLTYRWRADERDFAMPVRIGTAGKTQIIRPTRDWQIMRNDVPMAEFEVASELYYIDVVKERQTKN
jgi:hypothetical protein